MKLHLITKGLYQRGAFSHLPDKVDALKAAGIDVVISLWRADPDLPSVLEYVHQPMPDWQQIDWTAYQIMAGFAADRIRAGHTVLVHCQGGRNRSGLLNALIVRDLFGCPGAMAAQIVRLGRPGSLANPHFARFLQDLPAPNGGTEGRCAWCGERFDDNHITFNWGGDQGVRVVGCPRYPLDAPWTAV